MNKSQNFLAGANFIASRRRGSYFKCLVEWLHRREIASAGAIGHTNAVVRSMALRFSDWISDREKNEFRKSFEIIPLQRFGILFSESMTASRCETKKLYVAKQWWCMTPKFRKFDFFENIEAGEGFDHQI